MEWLTNFISGLLSKSTKGLTNNFSANLQDLLSYEIRAKHGMLEPGEKRPGTENGLSGWWSRNYTGSWLEKIVNAIGGFFMETIPEFIADFSVNGTHTNAAVVSFLDSQQASAATSKPLSSDIPADMQDDILKAASKAVKDSYAGWSRVGHMFSSSSEEAKVHAIGSASQAYQAVQDTALLQLIAKEAGIDVDKLSSSRRQELLVEARKNREMLAFSNSVAEKVTGLRFQDNVLQPIYDGAQAFGIYGAIVNNHKMEKGGTLSAITYGEAVTNYDAAKRQAEIQMEASVRKMEVEKMLGTLGVTDEAVKVTFTRLAEKGASHATDHAGHLTKAEIAALQKLPTTHQETAKALMETMKNTGLLNTITDIDFRDDGIYLQTASSETKVAYQNSEGVGTLPR